MKLSHKHIQNIKNSQKESCNNMLEIKEEKANQSSTGLALLIMTIMLIYIKIQLMKIKIIFILFLMNMEKT